MADRNSSAQPPETVVQDILDRLAELESGPRKWTAVRRDAIAEIKLLRDDVAESTAALSRAVMALMCKVDDIVRLRAEIERLRAEVYRIRSAEDGLAAVAINNAPGVSVKGNELAEANDDWDAARIASLEARRG